MKWLGMKDVYSSVTLFFYPFGLCLAVYMYGQKSKSEKNKTIRNIQVKFIVVLKTI